MNLVSHYYSAFHNSMPNPIKMVLNVLFFPIDIFGAIMAAVKGHPQESPIWQMSHEELAESFSFEIEKGGSKS